MFFKATTLYSKIVVRCCLVASSLMALPALAQTDIIDVMVLYSPEAASDRNGAIETYINSLIASSNTTYADSDMRARIRLVHTEQISISGAQSIDGTALNALRSNNRVNELRAEHGADLVALLIPATRSSNGTVCGIGYVANGSGGVLSRFARDTAFSISGSNCGSSTFTHELGHNMGLGHSREQGSRGGVFDFGLGYGVQNTFATTMAYDFVFNAPRVQRFSNPQQTCSGLPCGIGQGNSNAADAAFAVNSVSAQIANYLPSKSTSGGGSGVQADPVRSVPQVANNIIANASAEDGLNSWESRFSSDISSNQVRRLTGESSIQVSNRQSFASGVSQNLLNKLNNGGTYTISAAMRLAGEGSDAGRMAIGINDNQGTRYVYFDRIGINGDEWNTINGEFTLQTNGPVNSLFIHFYGPSTDKDFYIDQVSIVPVGQVTTPSAPTINNIALNGDLESAVAAPWETGFNGAINITNSGQYSGNYGLATTNRRAWYDGPMQRITSRVSSGKVYQLDAWVRMAGNTTQNIEARLYYNDNTGHNWKRFDIKRVDNNWVQLSGTVALQAIGTINTARLHFFGPSAANNFYIDDVVLQEK